MHRRLRTIRTIVTKGASAFPLDFDDSHWSLEMALPWIFVGDINKGNHQHWEEVSSKVVGYVVNAEEGRALKILSAQYHYIAERLHPHLRSLLPVGTILDRQQSYSPLTWCRIAVQFWLECGGRQEVFTKAMTQWVRNKNKSAPAFVYCDLERGGDLIKIKMPLTTFLFDDIDIDIENGVLKNFRLKSAKQKLFVAQVKQTTKPRRSAQNAIGKNALACVREMIQNAAMDRSIRNLKNKPDPKTQLYRYTGSRPQLYQDLCGIHVELASRYKQSVVIKAISQVAKCRKYWRGSS